MRPDFNKLLVERERHGSGMSFGDVRHNKRASESDRLQIGGRESMKRRHKIAGEYKSFNENLNPLKGFLHSKVGKKWDKVYSEIKKTFDTRGVINNHILEHLFDYVEINTKVVGGVSMILQSQYEGYVPIKKKIYQGSRYPSYYVCPKDGTLKTMAKQPRRSIIKQKEADALKKKLAVSRDIGTHHLFLEDDGVWYAYEIADLPPATQAWVAPLYMKPGHLFSVKRAWGKEQLKTWEELNEAERQQHGRLVVTGEVRDAREDRMVSRTVYTRGFQSRRRYGAYSYGQPTAGKDKYYKTKFQASSRMLKQAGIDGALAYNEELVPTMSHREAAKYRKAA